jgi:hypothetical protein
MPEQEQRARTKAGTPGGHDGSNGHTLRAAWTDIAIHSASTFVGRSLDKPAALRWFKTVLVLIAAGISAALFRHDLLIAAGIAGAGIAIVTLG